MAPYDRQANHRQSCSNQRLITQASVYTPRGAARTWADYLSRDVFNAFKVPAEYFRPLRQSQAIDEFKQLCEDCKAIMAASKARRTSLARYIPGDPEEEQKRARAERKRTFRGFIARKAGESYRQQRWRRG